MDVLVAMRTFRRVVERDSFSLAAVDLGQSTAAVSKQVRQLEARLGSLLLLRTTRRMSLSEAGQAYFSECCHLLDELDALERATQVGASEPSGRLRVNAPLSFGLKVLSPILVAFMQRYPELKVELTLNDRLLDVISEGFDVSLRIRSRLPDSSLIARRLGEVQQMICAAPAYLQAKGTPHNVDDLREHSCLAYRLAEYPDSWHLQGPQGSSRLELPVRLAVDNSLMLSDMLQAGLGIGALPSFIAQPLLDSGQLVQVLPGQSMPRRSIYALYTSHRHVPQKVRVFVDFLAHALETLPLMSAPTVAAGTAGLGRE
ncbi:MULTISPECIES: LysR family transcriptional regulator [Pseudomonas]|jgi:DNA-binding transcriptional LysR family regulator|uniref:LysR family transcriptional regulator n=1 Tax=Pseudomonas TaxID=286 RepID=UPI0008DA5F24|nr:MULTISPECIES: LysR family transcriptional regulator [Pseudomonas]VVO03730.1 HTH-type transcriptional regulator DmlR [Pseudomonas fluorescens]MBC3338935.1 LysR family transcriptional regulator [Pseudomonas proteolytica]NMY95677.1 LysR family transcriptional regulator [Pseudomonas proteolytica]NMZ01485.1 LysR family transcriptional regulator [Pseudomonas proteolytica]OHW40800.1 LysR family transcriptional regulator [Pseudomonas sp. 06C 126]